MEAYRDWILHNCDDLDQEDSVPTCCHLKNRYSTLDNRSAATSTLFHFLLPNPATLGTVPQHLGTVPHTWEPFLNTREPFRNRNRSLA
jgi:hypothetical protein